MPLLYHKKVCQVVPGCARLCHIFNKSVGFGCGFLGELLEKLVLVVGVFVGTFGKVPTPPKLLGKCLIGHCGMLVFPILYSPGVVECLHTASRYGYVSS